MNYKELSIKYDRYTDKFSYHGNFAAAHTYAIIYDRLFKPYQNKSINFLEIGLSHGGNVAICKEYFTDIHHYGIDINDGLNRQELTALNEDRFFFFSGSYNDSHVIEAVSKQKYDIILEDGSHLLEHQMESIDIYLPLLKQDGVMIIEDVAKTENFKALYSRIDFNCYYAYTIDLRQNRDRWDDLLFIIEHRDKKYFDS